jgi:hypothetical protein
VRMRRDSAVAATMAGIVERVDSSTLSRVLAEYGKVASLPPVSTQSEAKGSNFALLFA